MSKKFKTSYGTAGGSEYGYKSKAEAKRARAKTEALNTTRMGISSTDTKQRLDALYHIKRKNAGL